MLPTVMLETKCWEGDWRAILTTERLQVLSERNCYPFSAKVLMVNNVLDSSQVLMHARKAVERGWLTGSVLVEDHADEALACFGITRDSLGPGYLYSIAELVSIYLCQCDYLLHFSGDALPAGAYHWIPQAIDLLESDPRIKVANLAWNGRYQEAAAEAFGEMPDWYVGYGFSDQCYLVRTSDFRAPIYSERHPASSRYPTHAGELFEKRVDSWMRNHGYARATFRHGFYVHRSLSTAGPAARAKATRETCALRVPAHLTRSCPAWSRRQPAHELPSPVEPQRRGTGYQSDRQAK